MTAALSSSRPITGGFKELLLLFFPLAAVTFSNSAYLMIEKLFLVRLSTANLEAAMSATYACQPFQGSYVALVMMAQVFVGRCCGAQNWKAIGPGIWQFIWFSLLSTLITVPLGIIYGNFYFQGTEIEGIVLPYYYSLLGINFLFPLTIALASFYVGQGKTRLVLVATVCSQIIKIILAYILILGWEDWIPSQGLMGGAISTLVAQGGLCIALAAVFLNRHHAKVYGTRHWQLRLKLFWECLHPGMSRGICRVLTFLCWASVAHLMTVKGGDYLLILSVGGTLFIFFLFLADAVLQAQTTIASHILGANQFYLLRRAYYLGTRLVLMTLGCLALPCLVFPQLTFSYLFPEIYLSEQTVSLLFSGVWLSFAFFMLAYVSVSHIFAFKDSKFFLFMGFFNWINGYLLMYVAVDEIQIAPQYFWLTLAFMHASNALLYYTRMRWLESKALPVASSVLR